MLSLILFLPAFFGLLFLIVPLPRWVALIPVLTNIILVGNVVLHFDLSLPLNHFQFEQIVPWIPSLGLSFALGLDQLSLGPVVLTALISFGVLWTHSEKWFQSRKSVALHLFLQTTLYGTFLATDLFLFYFFWEMVLLPISFMILFWGGPEKGRALLKFLVYTLSGSLAMLLAMIYLLVQGKGESFALFSHLSVLAQGQPFPLWVFAAFMLAICIKIPLVPFHSWQADLYEHSPIVGSIYLASLISKMGPYALIRFLFLLFPSKREEMAIIFMTLAIVTFIYGAIVAWGQTHFKRFIAYSSLSHTAIIVVGPFCLPLLGLNGAMIQMFNHGILAFGLFFMAGILFKRYQTYSMELITDGVYRMPKVAFFFFLFILASLSFPGSASFVGELSLMVALYQDHSILASFAVFGMVFTALYNLSCYRQMMYGLKRDEKRFDLTLQEGLFLCCLVFIIVGAGLFPDLFFEKLTVTQIMAGGRS